MFLHLQKKQLVNLDFTILLYYLCRVLFRANSPLEMRIKREAGESPAQSRCCKLFMCFVHSQIPLPVVGGKEDEAE